MGATDQRREPVPIKISGPGITSAAATATDAAKTNFAGTFTQANNSKGNYVVFTMTGTQFTFDGYTGDCERWHEARAH